MANNERVNKKTLFRLLTPLIIVILYSSLIYGTIIDAKKSPYTWDEKVYDMGNNQKKIVMAFRNDDISAKTNVTHEKSVIDIFWKYKIKQTFATIPNISENPEDYNNENFHPLSKNRDVVEALKRLEKEGKIEFALQGYTHQRNKGSSGEFDHLIYKEQFEKIKKGKEILDTELNANVSIFAPPWNQADKNTMKACVNSGIHIFSGYMGDEPTKSITFVNTNAVLVKGIGLPQVEDVLEYAKNGSGITFVIVFYHSNTDFNEPSDYTYLNNLLGNLTNDTAIEISSIGEIAKKYKDFLPAYNQAGLDIKEADNAKHRVKPYILGYRKTNNLLGKDLSIDELSDKAFVAYWSGDYEHTSKLAIEIIEKCDDYILYGRIMVVICSGTAFLIFLGVLKYRKIKPSIRHYRNFLLIFVVPFVIVGGYLNIFHPVSAMRIMEFNIVSGLFLGGIAVLSAPFYAFRKKKNKYSNSNKKTIVTLHSLRRPGRTGKTYYLNRYNFLADNYALVLFTDDIGYIYFKSNVPNAKIIQIPYPKIPVICLYLFWLFCRLKLIFINYDLLFLRIGDMPFSFYLINKPILCHVDTEPYQGVGLRNDNDKLRTDRKIYLKSIVIALKGHAEKIIEPDNRLDSFSSDYNITPEKIEYIQAGVNDDLYAKEVNKGTLKYMSKGKFVLIYAGSLNEERGLFFLLKAMSKIAKESNDIVLLLIGQFYGDNTKEKFYDMVERLKLWENVVYAPPMKFKNLVDYYLASDIGISYLEPTKYFRRSTPQKIFEYFTAGLPVVANDIPSHTIYIKSGYNGYIFKNENGFINIILNLYKDRKKLEEMEKCAKEFSKDYSLLKIHTKFQEIIQTVLES